MAIGLKEIGKWRIDDLVQHSVNSIKQAEVSHTPFSHLYFRNLFPGDFYRELIQLIPDVTGYKQLMHPDAKQDDGTTTREILPFAPRYLDSMTSAQKPIFQMVKEVLNHANLMLALFEHLKPDLHHRAEFETIDQIAAYPKTGLFKDLSGYKILPHTDTHAKIVTMQIYLPKDESQKHFGTTLYRRHDECDKQVWQSRFKVHRTFEFMPNTGYAFVVGANSWHGREVIPDGCGNRYSIMNLFFDQDDVPFYD